MRRDIVPLVFFVLAATQTAVSAQTMNVQSLMGDGYKVAGVASPPAGGAGVFLQKGNTLFLFCHREARFGIPRYAILQTGEIVER